MTQSSGSRVPHHEGHLTTKVVLSVSYPLTSLREGRPRPTDEATPSNRYRLASAGPIVGGGDCFVGRLRLPPRNDGAD